MAQVNVLYDFMYYVPIHYTVAKVFGASFFGFPVKFRHKDIHTVCQNKFLFSSEFNMELYFRSATTDRHTYPVARALCAPLHDCDPTRRACSSHPFLLPILHSSLHKYHRLVSSLRYIIAVHFYILDAIKIQGPSRLTVYVH